MRNKLRGRVDELEAEVEDQPEAEIAESLSNLEVADDEKPEEEIADQGWSVFFFQLGRILDFIFSQNLKLPAAEVNF